MICIINKEQTWYGSLQSLHRDPCLSFIPEVHSYGPLPSHRGPRTHNVISKLGISMHKFSLGARLATYLLCDVL